MGVVYKARQIALERLVALKMIQHQAMGGSEQRERFQAEARAVARLQHPNIVQIYDFGEYQGWSYYAMELVLGGTLHERLARGALSPAEAARTAETLARAVHHAHGQGVIHRDVKPANVLLTAEGVLKVTDFGLARLADQSSRTLQGAIMGTPRYMAPEQAFGQTDRIGPAADIFSLGVVLYELLTGQTPFAGATTFEILDRLRTEEPAPPGRVRPGIPRDLDAVCLRCLRKEPGDRYPSAEALADDLRRFQDGVPVQTRPRGLWRRLLGG
jgi:serine/threonine protein kinase